MATTCSECGAVWVDEQNCQVVFDGFLVLDFTDPGYGAVHFLTVSTFMLQHGRYSKAAQAWVIPIMQACLAGETTAERIRRDVRAALGQGQRQWRVMRGKDAPPQRAVA